MQFEQAIASYETLLGANEQQAQLLKRRWLEVLKQWLQSKDFDVVQRFIDAFLYAFPYDLEILEVQADSWVAQNRTSEAINQYHTLISNTFETKQEEYYQARIHHLASEKLSALKGRGSWQAVVDFANEVRVQEPGYPPFMLAQAEAYVALGDFESADPLLRELLEISLYRDQARDLLAQIDAAKLQEIAIKLDVMGEHYLVNGIMNESSDIRLMIDTGASLSVLTKTRFEEIESWTDPEYMGETLLNTAGGQINAPIYQFDRFEIDGFYVNDISFVVIDLDNMRNYHGLLGMNFLKQFKFQIDQANNLLILSP